MVLSHKVFHLKLLSWFRQSNEVLENSVHCHLQFASVFFNIRLGEFFLLQVAPYKKVRRVAFINAIPKSPAGKILRRELVNHALSSGKSKI